MSGGLARLGLGQRVYVLRDGENKGIGAWGIVARMRRSDNGAWVRLDVRHVRCPFPADDLTRRTHVLTYPERCSSVAPAPAPEVAPARPCRRCSECRGQAHHWLTSIPECEPDDGGDPFIPCKHCDARAGICDDCEEGPVWPPTTNNTRCDACKGAR